MSAVKKPNLDSLTSVNADGSRYFLHPSDVSGRFTLWRRVFGALLLAVYVLLPWIPINGNPAVFLDLAERRFHFFGLTFLAEDLWIGFFLLTGLGFSLFYVTSLFGRLWCGWACPYTVFLDLIYRRIERLVDGDANQRKKLDASPLTGQKIAKRALKHGLYLLVSLAIAHIFISYFISIPRLYEYMRQSPLHHFKAFGVMLFLTGCLHFSFAWFREQFCIILCPYGRIQSALTDDDTVIIGYDAKRGEPRGKVSDPGAGACINCSRCVQVCPTGIDIRNGLQLECIGCAACIDACDDVMGKVGRPRGLIRYDSHAALAGGRTRWLRPRIVVYTVLLAIGIAVATLAFTSVKSANLAVVRMGGAAYFVGPDGVRNQFMVRLLNKSSGPATFNVALRGLPPGTRQSGLTEPVTLGPMAEQLAPLVLAVDRARYAGPFHATIEVSEAAGGFTLTRRIEFLGPDARLLQEEDAARGPRR